MWNFKKIWLSFLFSRCHCKMRKQELCIQYSHSAIMAAHIIHVTFRPKSSSMRVSARGHSYGEYQSPPLCNALWCGWPAWHMPFISGSKSLNTRSPAIKRCGRIGRLVWPITQTKSSKVAESVGWDVMASLAFGICSVASHICRTFNSNLAPAICCYHSLWKERWDGVTCQVPQTLGKWHLDDAISYAQAECYFVCFF